MKHRFLSTAIGIFSCAVLFGCEQSPPSILVPEIDLKDAAAPNVIMDNGSVRVSAANPQGQEIISPNKAIDLALAFTRSFGVHFLGTWERARGSQINLDALEPSRQVFFAESAYKVLSQSVPLPIRKGFGPYYLVTLLENHNPVISVAVSALATDLSAENGKLVSSSLYRGNEFVAHVIPPGGELPISAEDAVRIAAAASGQRIVNPPRLISPPVPGLAPQGARWELVLNRPITAETADGRVLRSTRLFVGHRGVLQLRDPESESPSQIRATAGAARGNVFTIVPRVETASAFRDVASILN